MKIVAALGVLVALMAPAEARTTKQPRKPYVIIDSAGQDACHPDEPLAPCPGRLLTVKNPLPRNVAVVVTCENTLLAMRVVMMPRETVLFDIVTDFPGGLQPGWCRIARWKVWRGGRWVQGR